jgi:RNA polymerase sigma-70 factor (sigma-E family)
VFDERVVEQRRASVPTGFEELRAAFDEHHVALLRLCMLLTENQDVAEDIVQEAFVRLAPKLRGLAPESVGPYVRRVAINLWKNRLRAMAVERQAAARITRRDDDVVIPALEEHDAMWHAILRLPRGQRACLVLRYYEDRSERETAAILGCSVGSVKRQSSRALARLRKELGDER